MHCQKTCFFFVQIKLHNTTNCASIHCLSWTTGSFELCCLCQMSHAAFFKFRKENFPPRLLYALYTHGFIKFLECFFPLKCWGYKYCTQLWISSDRLGLVINLNKKSYSYRNRWYNFNKYRANIFINLNCFLKKKIQQELYSEELNNKWQQFK